MVTSREGAVAVMSLNRRNFTASSGVGDSLGSVGRGNRQGLGHQPQQRRALGGPDDEPERHGRLAALERGEDPGHRLDARLHVEGGADVGFAEDEQGHTAIKHHEGPGCGETRHANP